MTGTKNFKIDVIKKHESLEIHTRNLSREQASRESLAESTATKTIVMMNKAAVDKLTLLFRNAHCIAKSGRPYTDYVTLCSLDQAKGLKIGNTYITDKYCQQFVSYIADVRRELQKKKVESASFLSLILDGSTDTSSKETEIVYIKTSVNCEVFTYFAGLKHVSKADADGISRAISSLNDLDLSGVPRLLPWVLMGPRL